MPKPPQHRAPQHPDAKRTARRSTRGAYDATRAVSPRTGARTDRATLHVADDSAVKVNTFTSHPGYPSGAAHWQTHLHLEAWVRNVTYAKHVWVDVHVFAHDGALVASETCALAYARPAGDGGDVFVLDRVVYEGTTATPGSADLRADVGLVQYRLYCELSAQVYTDGILHECELKSDVLTH